jgi:predicted RNA methylase
VLELDLAAEILVVAVAAGEVATVVLEVGVGVGKVAIAVAKGQAGEAD